MEKSRKKIRTALIIGICISIILLAALTAIVLRPFIAAKKQNPQASQSVYEKKYASEYILGPGENREVLGSWNIAKFKEDDGTEYLRIVRVIGLEDPVDYLHFEVYDSSSEAEAAYKELYDTYKGYDSGFVDCGGYFKSDEPADDASIYEMVYLKDNIIIFTELSDESFYPEVESTTVPDDGSPTEPTLKPFDRASLEKYIVENSDVIKIYVLEHLLKN